MATAGARQSADVPEAESNSSRPRTRVAILLNRDQDADAWRERHARGEVMDLTPYGYEQAGEWFDLTWSKAQPESPNGARLRRRAAAWLGFDIVHTWRNRRILFSAQVVWTHTEREHLAIALLQRLRRPARRVHVLAQSVWLWDRWQGYGGLRRRFIAWLLRTHRVEALHSPVNVECSRAAVPGRVVTLLPFGSAPVTREPSHPTRRTPLVLAVGNDADRDWVTFADAVAKLDGVEVRVASSSRQAQRVEWPANTICKPALGLRELADLYRAAAVVVVPARTNLHASGATSCIEALAARRPLVVTDAGGLQRYVEGAATLVPAGDPGAMASAIRAALDGEIDPEADPWIDRGLTQLDYVGRYVLLTRWMTGESPWPDAVGDFAPVTPL